MFSRCHLIFYLGCLCIIRNIDERRTSEINGEGQRAAELTSMSHAYLLPRRNVVQRRDVASIPFWTSFTAIFPLALSMDTASGIHEQQQLPPWPAAANALHRLRGMSRGANRQREFVNRHGQPLTRDDIAYIATKYVTAAAHGNPALLQKHLTPPVLRHGCAVALLQSGTEVTVIRDYPGHASVATTGRYITTNLRMKRDVMQAFWKKLGIEPANTKPWKPKADLLAFLQSL
jgi:Phage integrase family